MGKLRKKDKTNDDGGGQAKGRLQRVKKPLPSSSGTEKERPSTGPSSGIRTRRQKEKDKEREVEEEQKQKYLKAIQSSGAVVGPRDILIENQFSDLIKVEEYDEAVVKAEGGTGSMIGPSNEHEDILVDIPADVVVKMEVCEVSETVKVEEFYDIPMDYFLEDVEEDNENELSEHVKVDVVDDSTENSEAAPVCSINQLDYNRPLVINSKNPWVSDFDKILPHLFCDFEKPDWLKLRLVCSAWKNVTEDFVENHPIIRPFDLESHRNILSARHYALHKPENLPRLLFKRTTGIIQRKEDALNNQSDSNPFWLRTIVLDSHWTFAPWFWDAVEDFLKTFGHHVWHFSLNGYKDDELTFCKNLHRCLQNLPNLKSLFLGREPEVRPPTCDNDAKSLSKFINENSFPSLEHLDSLRFALNISRARKTMDALLLKYGGQLKRLDVNPKGWSHNYGNLPKLVQLNLEMITSCKHVRSLLWSLKAPKLEHLECICTVVSVEPQFLFELLEVLEPFKLRSLRISFKQTICPSRRSYLSPPWKATDWKFATPFEMRKRNPFSYQVDKCLITLPSVEQLFVQVFHETQSLQFLRCFPSLKYLELVKPTGAVRGDDVGMELMKCKNGGKASRQSKIWEMFPRLKEINFVSNGSIFVDRAGYFYRHT